MSTHHGYIKEFPFIRVDAFDGAQHNNHNNPYSRDAPHFYLLTHAHTDHLKGLNSPDFDGQVFCTAATKCIILNTMDAANRVIRYEIKGVTEASRRKFPKLVPARGVDGRTRKDRIKELLLNQPTKIDGPNGSVTVTAFDANHCPGSAMFLIEGMQGEARRAIIVTGDIRAEPWWVESLRRNPLLSPYIAPPAMSQSSSNLVKNWPSLDCIYFDTSYASTNEEFLPKQEASDELVRMMAAYPPDAKFFLNCWTWGYEDMMKSVAKTFDSKIHLDWYKERIYSHPALTAVEPLLSTLASNSKHETSRFHACERRWKCDEVWADGIGCYEFAKEHLPSLASEKRYKVPGVGGREEEDKKVVYVNPIAMTREKWEAYKEKMDGAIRSTKERGIQSMLDFGKNGERDDDLPNYLIAPLARHSPLPELRAFISLFRPQTVYPLTIDEVSQNPCLDYLALSAAVGDCLASGGKERLAVEAQQHRKYVLALRKRRQSMGMDDLDMGGQDEDDMIEGIQGFEQMLLALKGLSTVTACVMNAEGGAAICSTIADWARVGGDQREIVLSPSTKKKRKQELKEDVLIISPTPSPDQPPPAPPKSSSTAYPSSASTTLQKILRPPSPAADLPIPRVPYPTELSLLYPTSTPIISLSSESRQLLPSIELKASKSSVIPEKGRLQNNPTVPILSENRATPAPMRKTVSFVSPTRSSDSENREVIQISPELALPSTSPSSSTSLAQKSSALIPPTSSISVLQATASTSQLAQPPPLPVAPTSSGSSTSPRKKRKITARPSADTRTVRKRMVRAIITELKGKVAKDGSIVPFALMDSKANDHMGKPGGGREAGALVGGMVKPRSVPASFQSVSASPSTSK